MQDGLVRVIVRLEAAVMGLEQQLAEVTAERDALRSQADDAKRKSTRRSKSVT